MAATAATAVAAQAFSSLSSWPGKSLTPASFSSDLTALVYPRLTRYARTAASSSAEGFVDIVACEYRIESCAIRLAVVSEEISRKIKKKEKGSGDHRDRTFNYFFSCLFIFKKQFMGNFSQITSSVPESEFCGARRTVAVVALLRPSDHIRI